MVDDHEMFRRGLIGLLEERGIQVFGEAILAAGASITHHHGIGRDHRRWLAGEIGELGVAVLASVKLVAGSAAVVHRIGQRWLPGTTSRQPLASSARSSASHAATAG